MGGQWNRFDLCLGLVILVIMFVGMLLSPWITAFLLHLQKALVTGMELRWFADYLNNRIYHVKKMNAFYKCL